MKTVLILCVDCGKKISSTAKRCMSCYMRVRDTSGARNPFFGSHHTKETKTLISKGNTGKLSRERHPNWKGGRGSTGPGHPYIRINIGKNERQYEHRLVMEKHLKRKLTSEEVVHHINGNSEDNRLKNLTVLSNSEHRKLHSLTQPKEHGKFHAESTDLRN